MLHLYGRVFIAVGIRLLPVVVMCFLWVAVPTAAQETAPPPARAETPAPVGDDAVRLLELGKLLMGQNNPTYAQASVTLDAATRNAAGEQALRIVRRVVKLQPKYADGWLWLGIALTETLEYSKAHPKGAPLLTEERVTEGIAAFQKAFEAAPTNLVCISYYSEALMAFRKDFDTTRRLWENYARVATTDMQRVTAFTQAARACLNKAYFGKIEKMAPEEVKQHYLAAENLVAQAAKLCPNSEPVKDMQLLLQQHRKSLLGKD